ncbi:hypothetical protein GCM10009574_085130 [Streptomyces asiaticus]|uniref:Uncharacterized protein n=2 Tax=Streptomyces rhizosphaericus TaxID=114699 RepID=A0ABN1RML0_9ACTN
MADPADVVDLVDDAAGRAACPIRDLQAKRQGPEPTREPRHPNRGASVPSLLGARFASGALQSPPATAGRCPLSTVDRARSLVPRSLRALSLSTATRPFGSLADRVPHYLMATFATSERSNIGPVGGYDARP